MKPLLEVRHLSISFHTYRGLLEAVHAVSLTVHAGETVGICLLYTSPSPRDTR